MVQDRHLLILLAAILLITLAVLTVVYFGAERQEGVALDIPVGAPIVLIHGLGGNAEGWVGAGLVDFFSQAGLCYGGALSARADGGVEISAPRCPISQSSLFTFQVSDPWSSLDLWSQELTVVLPEVRRGTGAPQVVLVGFSAGGLAARQYLVGHPTNHGVAELVTVASPHGGSELALFAQVAKFVDNLEGPLRTTAEDILVEFERVLGERLSSPLVAELMPPSEDNYLARLNRAPHPTDLEYSCIVSAGTPGALSPRRLRTGLARLRSGDRDLSVLGQLLTYGMRLLAIGGGNDSASGDGAALLAAQNLGRAEFFQTHPRLLREVELIEADHFAVKTQYTAIAAAIAGEPEVVEVRGQSIKGERFLNVLLRDHMPVLTRIQVLDAEDREIAVSSPRGFRRRGHGFVQVRVGPLSEGSAHFDLILYSFGGAIPRGVRLTSGGEVVEMPGLRPGNYHFSILKAWGFNVHQWDIIGNYPDVEAILYVDDVEVLRSRRFDDLRGLEVLGPLGEFRLNGDLSRVSLELHDIDFSGLPESMGMVSWLPGRLPLGRSIVALDSGVVMEVEFLPVNERRPIQWSTAKELPSVGGG